MRTGTDSLAFRHRSALKLMTMANSKTHKGEKHGYLSGILYLMPHDSGGGVTLCPHSTPACREMCLAGAGLSGLPLQLRAKQRRTDFYLADPVGFATVLGRDMLKLIAVSASEGMTPVVRLNGTSDILWERVAPGLFGMGVQMLDYTKVPLEHRRPPANYHLTYSYMGPADAERAVRYLAAGHSVAVVVPLDVKDELLSRPDHRWPLIDGDAHDLRFLDPPGSVVLLKPKGHKRTSLVRPDVLGELARAARVAA